MYNSKDQLLKIKLISAKPSEIQTAFELLKHASEKLEGKGIKQWDYWQNPPQEKIDWVNAGFKAGEFYFIKNEENDTLGIVRMLDEDQLYWGRQTEKAKYIHSLVVHEDFAGLAIGKQVVQMIEQVARNTGCDFLRLDCDASNPKLCAYYTKQEFKKVGEKKLPLGIYNLYQKEI